MSDDKRLVEERVTRTLALMKAMTRLSMTDYFADGTYEIARASAEARRFSLESYYAYSKGWEDAFNRIIKWLEIDLAGRRCSIDGDPLD